MEGKEAGDVARGLDEQRQRLQELAKQAAQLEAGSGGGDLDTRIREVEQLVAEGDRDSVDLADQMVRLMTRQIDVAEGKASKDKVRIDFDSKIQYAQAIIKSEDHRAELEALRNEFRTALERDDYDVAKTKELAADNLLLRVEMETLRFWQNMLGWLYQKFTELNMLHVGQQQFQEAAQIYDREDCMQNLINICMELLGMLPPEARHQFEGAAAVAQSHVM